MELNLDSPPVLVFVFFIFPGLISMKIYRLLMPARAIDWSNVTLEALFYGAINFGLLCFPTLAILNYYEAQENHPFWLSGAIVLSLVIGPLVWPYLLVKCLRSKRFMAGLQLPYPTAWDYFFDKREPAFLLFHLRNGKMIGGYYGSSSYAGAFPSDGDVYLERVCKTNKDGTFEGYVHESCGMIIRRDAYDYVELLQVPATIATDLILEETSDAEQ